MGERQGQAGCWGSNTSDNEGKGRVGTGHGAPSGVLVRGDRRGQKERGRVVGGGGDNMLRNQKEDPPFRRELRTTSESVSQARWQGARQKSHSCLYKAQPQLAPSVEWADASLGRELARGCSHHFIQMGSVSLVCLPARHPQAYRK